MKAVQIGGGLVVLIIAAGAGWWLLRSRLPAPRATQGGLVLVSEGLPQEQEWRHDFTFADMDGDGVLDLVTAPPRKGTEPWPHIFLRYKDRWQQACVDTSWGGFPDKQTYTYGGVVVADFDGTGVPQIALAMHETGIRLFKSHNRGPCGPWEERQDLPRAMTHMRTRAIVAADMNRDGRIDLVALSEVPAMNAKPDTPGIVIFWNEAAGWRPQGLPGSEGLFGDDVAVGEVNGDGVPDIAAGSLDDQRPQFVWLSDGAGGWQAAADGLPELTIAWSVQLVDLDNDGKDELVFGAGGAPMYQNAGPRAYRWDGMRWNSISQGLPQVSWVCGVTAADLDGGGWKEIVAAGMYTGMVQVYGRQADGAWAERQSFAVPNAKDLRNYKVRALSVDSARQEMVVANFASESGGEILAWVWR
ncbi:MAG: VCBS repeat-containing protein [Deltaproteobacteria bacterium]|nr:VCBS repeat-containing protein [Deltaproteobacteria bacterium]